MTDSGRVPSAVVATGTRAPVTEDERKLVALQKDVSRGNLAVIERNALLMEMFESGSRQRDLVALLNHGVAAVGDTPVTEGAVHKAIRRLRNGEVRAARMPS